jgi:hypothetical protein
MILTEKQLNEIGWESKLIYSSGSIVLQKGTREEGYELIFNPEELTVHFSQLSYFGLDDIYRSHYLTLHPLKCKDLDLFNQLIKILEIK